MLHLASLATPSSQKVLRDGAVEHDRFCPQPWLERTLCVRMGVEVGQRQGVRPAAAAAAGMGRTRGFRQKARRRSAVARYRLANLNVKRADAVSTVRINEDVLASIVKVAGELAGRIDAVAPSIDGLLAIKGVIEVVEPESNKEEDQGGPGRRGQGLRGGTRRSRRDAAPRGRCAGPDPEPAHGRDGTARRQGRGRPGASPRRSARGSPSKSRPCSNSSTASIPIASTRRRF